MQKMREGCERTGWYGNLTQSPIPQHSRDEDRLLQFRIPRSALRSSLRDIPYSTIRVPRSGFRTSSSAFTTIELLVVVIIAFILLALLGVLWKNLDARNKKSSAQTQLAYLQTALQDYRNETGAYPSTLSEISNRLPRAFTSFHTNGVPIDPWGAEYSYTYISDSTTYTLQSCGPDRKASTTDDNITPGRF